MPVNLSAPNPDDLHAVPGVELGVTMAGVRKANRRDVLVVKLAEGSAVAGVFTRNRFCAAPVQVCREHLAALDYLRQGIHLRGYAQKNPKQEYKREAFELFSQLLDVVKMEVTRVMMTVRIQTQEQVAEAAAALEQQASALSNVTYTHPNEDGSVSQVAGAAGLA